LTTFQNEVYYLKPGNMADSLKIAFDLNFVTPHNNNRKSKSEM